MHRFFITFDPKLKIAEIVYDKKLIHAILSGLALYGV